MTVSVWFLHPLSVWSVLQVSQRLKSPSSSSRRNSARQHSGCWGCLLVRKTCRLLSIMAFYLQIILLKRRSRWSPIKDNAVTDWTLCRRERKLDLMSIVDIGNSFLVKYLWYNITTISGFYQGKQVIGVL